MHYIGDTLDRAIPVRFASIGRSHIRSMRSGEGQADILKFPPTKNWRAMVADGYVGPEPRFQVSVRCLGRF